MNDIEAWREMLTEENNRNYISWSAYYERKKWRLNRRLHKVRMPRLSLMFSGTGRYLHNDTTSLNNNNINTLVRHESDIDDYFTLIGVSNTQQSIQIGINAMPIKRIYAKHCMPMFTRL